MSFICRSRGREAGTRQEVGRRLAAIWGHAMGLLLEQWTMKMPAANPHPPDALCSSIVVFFQDVFQLMEGNNML